MKFADKLYWGTAAKLNKRRILSDLRHDRFCPAVCVVALSPKEGELMEVIPSSLLCGKLYKKTHDISDLKVVGIGLTRAEALALMCEIAKDIYKETNAFEIKDYFGFN